LKAFSLGLWKAFIPLFTELQNSNFKEFSPFHLLFYDRALLSEHFHQDSKNEEALPQSVHALKLPKSKYQVKNHGVNLEAFLGTYIPDSHKMSYLSHHLQKLL
jgi:hypothetical protein